MEYLNCWDLTLKAASDRLFYPLGGNTSTGKGQISAYQPHHSPYKALGSHLAGEGS